MRARPRRSSPHVGALVPLLLGCVGVVGGAAPPEAGRPAAETGQPEGPVGAATPATPGSAIPGSAAPASEAPATPPPSAASPRLFRLTEAQYRNTVRDIFGSGVASSLDLDGDMVVAGFASVGAGRVSVSERAAELYQDAAARITSTVFGEPARRRALAPCEPSRPDDVACARALVGGLGSRLWRRPLPPEEVEALAGWLADAGRSPGYFWAAAAITVAGMMQSPRFVFRVEVGEPDPERPGRRRLTAHEMAARLSYALWNTTPDEALLQAAAAGRLVAREGIEAEAARLRASSRFRTMLIDHVAERLDLGRIPSPLRKDGKLFPAARSATFARSIVDEMRMVIGDALFGGQADALALLDGRVTYLNAELAELYGMPAPAGTALVRAEWPADGPRRGLLGHAAVLVAYSHSDRTNPTALGKFVRTRLLCQQIPPPPDDLDTSLPADPANRPHTQRQRLELHRRAPSCAPCHALIDPIGLALESFDAIGRLRETDAGQPIDASEVLDGQPFADAAALAGLLARHPAASRCAVAELARALIAEEPGEADAALLDALLPAFEKSGRRLSELAGAIVTTERFRAGP